MAEAQARSIILREAEFRDLVRLDPVATTFGSWALALRERPELLADAASIAKLVESSHAFETFLDDHGARQNRAFATFGELVASVRGLSLVRSIALHLRSRLPRYLTIMIEQELLEDLEKVDSVLEESLSALLGRILADGRAMGLPWDERAIPPRDAPAPRQLLPRDVDADEAADERQFMAQIGGRYLAVLDASRNLDLHQVRSARELGPYASKHATEERCRWYESSVHSIQSMYDTYIQGTALEREQPWIAYLRGHVSVALHLLEMATGLVHFYERHENDVRHAPARQAVASLVSKVGILDSAINVCLRRAYLYVEAGAEIADRLVSTFVPQDRMRLEMPEGVTLHARPLALIVQIVKRYGMPVEISFDGESCQANSLMALIMLGGSHPMPKRIEARGDARALADLQLLFSSGLGEQGSLPERLSYLGR